MTVILLHSMSLVPAAVGHQFCTEYKSYMSRNQKAASLPRLACYRMSLNLMDWIFHRYNITSSFVKLEDRVPAPLSKHFPTGPQSSTFSEFMSVPTWMIGQE